MEAMKLFDVILFGFGGYVVYGSCRMKKTGVICNWIADEKNIMEKQSDLQGFVQKVFPPTLLLGVLCLLYGLVSAVNDFYKPLLWGNRTIMVCFVLYAIWYCVRLQSWKEEFLNRPKMPMSANRNKKK